MVKKNQGPSVGQLMKDCQERMEHNGFWCEHVDCKDKPDYIIQRPPDSNGDLEVVMVCRNHATVHDVILRWYNKVWRVWEES